MANISKHRMKKLTSQITEMKSLIKNHLPMVLKEIKSCFVRVPGEVSRLSEKITAVAYQISKSDEVVLNKIRSDGKIERVAVTLKDIEKDVERLDKEMWRVGKKYKDISLMSHAVEHFHQIAVWMKKALQKATNEVINILNMDISGKELLHGKVLGTKMKGKRI